MKKCSAEGATSTGLGMFIYPDQLEGFSLSLSRESVFSTPSRELFRLRRVSILSRRGVDFQTVIPRRL